MRVLPSGANPRTAASLDTETAVLLYCQRARLLDASHRIAHTIHRSLGCQGSQASFLRKTLIAGEWDPVVDGSPRDAGLPSRSGNFPVPGRRSAPGSGGLGAEGGPSAPTGGPSPRRAGRLGGRGGGSGAGADRSEVAVEGSEARADIPVTGAKRPLAGADRSRASPPGGSLTTDSPMRLGGPEGPGPPLNSRRSAVARSAQPGYPVRGRPPRRTGG